ncbi:hypothetical protein [Alteromonas sp.]|uniref:hypothetical protein n=1 Tax=Alteromonas sp. TaxID=232 RepID=UPI00257E15F5|nr:hypothetical protein [Alteromonas sp.]NQY17000.1 hypothetical protein [Alteromonas sp.]
MRSNVFLSVLLSALIAFSTVSFAQEGNVPGLQIRNLLVTEIEEGAAVEQAATEVSQTVLSEGMYFDAAGLSYLSENQPTYQSLVGLLNDNSTGFELAIAGLTEMPEQPTQVVTIAILMFPEEANEIYNIALQMQVVTEEEALLAVINAGVDPSTLTATAAGATGNAVTPLGAGTGAAGAGGGDTTISAN